MFYYLLSVHRIFSFVILHYILYILCGMPHLVKPFGGDVGTVLPEDGLVETELDELVLVAQFLKCSRPNTLHL